jgi:membrane associated rhomboid family serine protease
MFDNPNLNLTTLIILVTCVISYLAEENRDMKEKWLHSPYLVKKRGEYYRWLSSGFVHDGYMHLAFNMIAFYNFGRAIEMIFASTFGNIGLVLFVFFYLSAIVISDLPNYFRFQDNYLYKSLGASGGVTAIVFSGLLFFPLAEVSLIFLPIPMPFFIFAGLYLFYTYYMTQHSHDNINHGAHLLGAVYGLVFTVVLYPNSLADFVVQISHWKGFF